jgi:hypothetical protein
MTDVRPYAGYNQGAPSLSAAGGVESIKSHSSVLFNERLSQIFYVLEQESTDLKIKPTLNGLNRVYGLLSTLWKMIRPVVSMNPRCINAFRLNTDTPGIYIIDVGMHNVGQYLNSFRMSTTQLVDAQKFFQAIDDLDQVEISIRNILQFYNYFIRPEYQQKPDIHHAAERFRAMADENTLKELEQSLGKSARVKSATENDKALDMDFSDIEDMDLEKEQDIDLEND